MTKSTCNVEGCERKYEGRGFCKLHLRRMDATGTTEPRQRPTLAQRFWPKVSKSAGCWLWAGSRDEAGYGRIVVDGKLRGVHRVAWELTKGPIPEGMVIDHKCHDRACVKPDHLRLATSKQNSENRRGPAANNVDSGVRGVHKADKKWSACLTHHGKRHYLGRYPTVEEAEAVVIEARRRIFTHSQD